VTLNDTLNYGVQFFIASQQYSVVNTGRHLCQHRHRYRAVGAASNTVNAAASALLTARFPVQFPDRRREFAARHSRRAT